MISIYFAANNIKTNFDNKGNISTSSIVDPNILVSIDIKLLIFIVFLIFSTIYMPGLQVFMISFIFVSL